METIGKIPRADAVLKNLPDEEQAEIFSWFKATDDRKAMTLEQALAALAARGISVSLSSLSEWRSWYSLARRMERYKARAEQARMEYLLANPDATQDRLDEVAQMVFTAEAIDTGDRSGYVEIATLRLKARAAAQAERKLDIAASSKITAGLDELRKEIADNPRALAIWSELEQEVKKS